jgi:hypothetical protein
MADIAADAASAAGAASEADVAATGQKRSRLIAYLSDPPDPEVDKHSVKKSDLDCAASTKSTELPPDADARSETTAATLEFAGDVTAALDDELAVLQASINNPSMQPLTADALIVMEKALHGLATQQAATSASSFDPSMLSASDLKRMEAHEVAKTNMATSYIANQFRLAHKPGSESGDMYKALNREEAKLFRAKWAEKQYNDWKESKTHEKSWRRIDREHGSYMTIDQLLMNEGGEHPSTDAVAGVHTLVAKNVTMGSPWVAIHPQTKRTLYLVLRFEYQEEYAVSWTTCQNEMSHGNLAVVNTTAAPDAADDVATVVPPTTSPRRALPADKGTTPKPKVKAKAKVKSSTAPASAGGDDALWKDAQKMKALFSKTTSAALDVGELIKLNAEWSWAANAQNGGALEADLVSLKAKLTPFIRAFITEDSSGMKKRFGEEILVAELTQFVGMKVEVLRLAAKVNQFKQRHAK